MPYFKDLRDRLEQVSLWGDLRKEQGARARIVMSRVERELERAMRSLERMPVDRGLRACEPDDLEAIRALRPKGPRRMVDTFPGKGLGDRLKAAWLARAAGCTLGAPVENWTIAAMEGLAQKGGMAFPPKGYWRVHPEPDTVRYGLSPIADYLAGGMRGTPVDDDVTYTVLGLLILERFGPGFTSADVGQAWLDWLPVACTAEHVALENLRKGIPALQAAESNNPYVEWIGADIRADPWGYAAPGWPERAAEMAYRDAYLSHRRNGIYGEMFFAAAIAAAFVTHDPIAAMRIGLTEIPEECRLARDVAWALGMGPGLSDWREARARVDERFAGMHAVHTINNACLTIFGLFLGQGDYTETLGITVAMGLDNDCTAATAGSLLGAAKGMKGFDEAWWKPFKNKTRTYLRGYEWLKNTEIVARFGAVAEKVWNQ